MQQQWFRDYFPTVPPGERLGFYSKWGYAIPLVTRVLIHLVVVIHRLHQLVVVGGNLHEESVHGIHHWDGWILNDLDSGEVEARCGVVYTISITFCVGQKAGTKQSRNAFTLQREPSHFTVPARAGEYVLTSI